MLMGAAWWHQAQQLASEAMHKHDGDGFISRSSYIYKQIQLYRSTYYLVFYGPVSYTYMAELFGRCGLEGFRYSD